MTRQLHDSPYRDDYPSSHTAPVRRQDTRSEYRPASHRVSHDPHALHELHPDPSAPAPTRGRSRRRRGRHSGTGTAHQPLQLTSMPTSRNAYQETREWLLKEHGPVCAYCARRFAPGVMTLDHVAPRRGRTAYDRRDNLVLACPGCNAAKRDMAPLAFLLASRGRAANLVRYGRHLSPMLLDMARSLAPDGATADDIDDLDALDIWDELDDGESPYRD